LIVLAAYACGSIPTGLWLGRRLGIDVRAAGSGNIGATNVARTVGTRAGLITLAADLAKGAIPVLGAIALGATPAGCAAAAVAAVLGHVFPLFAGFRGGKGVATAAGAFAVLAPAALAIASLVFAAVAATSRRVSLASVSAVLALPLAVLALAGDRAALFASIAVAVVVTAKHRENLQRLAAGTEPAFQLRKR
jgi:glycerol-3-phosphate acyltransferase PlsY